MTTRDSGGPAFPSFEELERYDDDAGKYRDYVAPVGGMDLRDYFAAQALPALLEEYFRGNGTCMGTDHAKNNCASHAYAYADAMLAERKK